MVDIEKLDVESFVTEAVTNVFDMMLSMKTEAFKPDSPPDTEGDRVVATVGFSGGLVGAICIQLKQDFARLITATMLGIELNDIEGIEEVKDVIGELGNMIGGSVKSRFCDADLRCVISIPSITHGSDFNISTLKGAKKKRFYFRHQQGISLVELYLKT